MHCQCKKLALITLRVKQNVLHLLSDALFLTNMARFTYCFMFFNNEDCPLLSTHVSILVLIMLSVSMIIIRILCILLQVGGTMTAKGAGTTK